MSYTEQNDANYKKGLSNDIYNSLGSGRTFESSQGWKQFGILHSETFSRRVRHLENILFTAKEYNYLDFLLKQWALCKTDNLGISHLMSVYPT